VGQPDTLIFPILSPAPPHFDTPYYPGGLKVCRTPAKSQRKTPSLRTDRGFGLKVWQ